MIDAITCLPFDLKRVFYVYDMPNTVRRGGHAHYKLHQFICCLSGSLEISLVEVDQTENKYVLSEPCKGFYLPPMTWSYEKPITPKCIYMVAASDYYDENDYIFDFQIFQELK